MISLSLKTKNFKYFLNIPSPVSKVLPPKNGQNLIYNEIRTVESDKITYHEKQMLLIKCNSWNRNLIHKEHDSSLKLGYFTTG